VHDVCYHTAAEVCPYKAAYMDHWLRY